MSKNKITISIDFTSKDKGYNSLMNKKILTFLHNNIKKGKNLIQTQHNKPFYVKKTKIYLQAVSIKKWNIENSWDKILCKKYNDFIKHTPCNRGSSTKLFVKIKSSKIIGGFGCYLMALHMGIISKKQHIQFVTALKKIFKSNPIIIHNEDVDWFHLKQLK